MWQYFFDTAQPQDDGDPALHFIEFSRSIYGHSRPFHAHPDCHILFCTRGRAFLRLQKVELDIRPGILAVIPAGVLHSFGPREEGLEFWGISFSPAASDNEVGRMFSSHAAFTASFSGYLDYVNGAFLYIYEIANRMKDVPPLSPAAQREAEQIIRRQALLLLYLAKSVYFSRPCRYDLSQDQPMDSAIRWIMEHYAENITLDSLALRFALSPSHFSRKFQDAFQVSPINYLIDYRISAAKDLLIHTDKPISQIAEEVGYQNPYHFSSLFSRRTGLTPQEMRAICRHSTTQPVGIAFSGDPAAEQR